MSEINAIATNNYLLATQQEVSHDNTLSGNGTVDSPLGVNSDYIVVTEETVGSYTVNTNDVQVAGTFSKAGYKPIAWTWKYGYAAYLNFNQETTTINADNSLYFQGYIKRVVGSGDMSITFKLFITWVRV
jgi:hypothetical protein